MKTLLTYWETGEKNQRIVDVLNPLAPEGYAEEELEYAMR